MISKFMGWLVVLAAVAVLGWQAHDWVQPPQPATPHTVYVPVQAPQIQPIIIDPNGRHPDRIDPN